MEQLEKSGLVCGRTLGVDSTTLEMSAALRSIVRRDSGSKQKAWLEEPAKASGIETSRREDLIKLDRQRKSRIVGVATGSGIRRHSSLRMRTVVA